ANLDRSPDTNELANGADPEMPNGAGSNDTISYNSTTHLWTWTDGDTQVQDTYCDVATNNGRIQSTQGNGGTLTYTYDSSNRLIKITTDNGQGTVFNWDSTTGNLTSVVTMAADGVTVLLTRVTYSYDSKNRLSKVTTDLTPTD